MKKRKHNYLIGYEGEGQVAYGKIEADKLSWVYLLTLTQAKRQLKHLISPDVKKAVYKLVKVR